MNVIPFKISGTEEAHIQVKAGAVYFRSAVLSNGATDETIIITGQGGGETLILEPGQGCPVDSAVTHWRVRSAGGVGTVEGKLVFGNAGFTDNRLKVQGTVQVVDGGKTRTIGGAAFNAYASKAVAASGNRPIVGLWNPVGSGKNVYVKSAIISSGATAQFIGIIEMTAPLGALARMSKSKKIGSPDGITEVRSLEQPAYTGGHNLIGSNVASSATVFFTFQEPYLLSPGTGIAVNGSDVSAGASLTAAFELIEELIGS